MKLLQIAFIAALGAACFATCATSGTLHALCDGAEQDSNPAPQSC
ncbi:MAG: hypothetical protein ACJAVT_000895 [Yoonia sp.]|jgi:hypothetical protein